MVLERIFYRVRDLKFIRGKISVVFSLATIFIFRTFRNLSITSNMHKRQSKMPVKPLHKLQASL